MAKLNNDTWAGLALLVFSLIHVFYLTPSQVELHRDFTSLALSPRLFCYITGSLLGFLSAVLIYLSLRKNGRGSAETVSAASWQPLFRGLFSTALACVYVILAQYIGVFVSTALVMTAFLLYFGVKKWSGILLFLVVILGFIYLLFVQALKVVMPDGLLF